MSDTTRINASFQLILDTAEKLIQQKGCRQTTLQDIIEHSGLSKGAIYHYVSGKDELFGLILESKVELMNDQFVSVVSQAAARDATGPIRFATQSMSNQSEDQQVSNAIFIYLLGQIDNPKVAAVLQKLYRYAVKTATQWIETGQTAGAIPQTIDAAKMASMFMVFTYGLRVQNMIEDSTEGRVEMDDIFKIVFRTLQ
ncbi:AcrR family transcriptional regulator [Paenibacillus castaneae]|uniref:TetR/AcrR family transcriptional regulator n=1 Tax=Paenibacillus castaneae TaxID=474957 RepID=UPI00141BB4D2|nr:TetR/AcrR family transcriptional regulator [Paenibacillus castaneae]NIK79158.1 AcrR family transcriptional regulator [Paenibacillus castaneae]